MGFGFNPCVRIGTTDICHWNPIAQNVIKKVTLHAFITMWEHMACVLRRAPIHCLKPLEVLLLKQRLLANAIAQIGSQCANGYQCLHKKATLPERQCVNGDHHLCIFFSKIMANKFWDKKRVSLWQWPAKIRDHHFLVSLCANRD